MFTIKQVSEMTDTPPHTLRFWEKEFEGILTPIRTKGGQRRYKSEHISLVKRIKELKVRGASLSGIKSSLSRHGNGVTPSMSHVLEDLVDRLTDMIRTEIYESFRRLDGRLGGLFEPVREIPNSESETEAEAGPHMSTESRIIK